MNTIDFPQRCEVYRLLSLMSLGVFCAVCITLSGCAAPAVGSRGHDAFLADSEPRELTGASRPADAARCFEETARFLPLSEFSRDAVDATFVYRLRIADLWFEQFRLVADGSGSRVEIRAAPGLDARWLEQLERDRVAPIRRCIGQSTLTGAIR